MPPLNKQYFIGIDPGASGGIVVVNRRGAVEDYFHTPETLMELWSIFEQITRRYSSATAVIEKVHAMPKQGATSMFSFGMRLGELLMALTAAGIPFQEVPPKEWQKAFRIVGKKPNESGSHFKTRILTVAHRLFPDVPLWKEPKSKGKQLSICDALLMAEFCRRTAK